MALPSILQIIVYYEFVWINALSTPKVVFHAVTIGNAIRIHFSSTKCSKEQPWQLIAEIHCWMFTFWCPFNLYHSALNIGSLYLKENYPSTTDLVTLLCNLSDILPVIHCSSYLYCWNHSVLSTREVRANRTVKTEI